MKNSIVRLVVTLSALLGAGLVMSGCNYLAPANYILEGAGQTPAEHTLEQVETLVFVDDATNVLPRTLLRSSMATDLSNDLMARMLVSGTVSPTDAMAMVRARERNGSRMSIESIASEVGVTQMIFVEMESFSLTERQYIPRPNASCFVKVLDMNKGARVYPIDALGDEGGRRVSVTMREIPPETMRSASGRRQAQMNLASTLAEAVVKLFYEHATKELGENLGIK